MPSGDRHTPTGDGRCSGTCWRRNIGELAYRNRGPRKSVTCWRAWSGSSPDPIGCWKVLGNNVGAGILVGGRASGIIGSLLTAHQKRMKEIEAKKASNPD